MPDITVPGSDGEFAAYLARPARTPAPGVVVIQEIFGVNKVMRDICDWLAGEGFLACSPDLFWRIEPGIQLTDQTDAEWQQAFDLMGKFDVDKGVEDLKTTLATLRKTDGCNGKAGSIGYCLGGKLAFLMATRTDSECNVSYYGVGLDDLIIEADHITAPLLLHMADEDRFFGKEGQDKVKAVLAKSPKVTILSYPGCDHAFARDGGEHYDAGATLAANAATLAALKDALL